MAPAEEHAPLTHLPSLDLVQSQFVRPRGDAKGGTIPVVQTPKRTAGNLDAPSPQRACTYPEEAKDLEAMGEKEMGDLAFGARFGFAALRQ